MKSKKFSSSNLSEAKKISKKAQPKKSKWILKGFLILIWIFVIFFLSVSAISWFKWVFDKIKQTIISSVSKTVWTPMKTDQYGSVNVLLLWYGWACFMEPWKK